MTGELGSCLTPPVGVERVVGFFVGTVAGHLPSRLATIISNCEVACVQMPSSWCIDVRW